MSRVSIHVDERGPEPEAQVKGWSSVVQQDGKNLIVTQLQLDHGLIVSWHRREGGGVWATVRLPLLESMEEMAAMVGEMESDGD
jgi:hypothetical protein